MQQWGELMLGRLHHGGAVVFTGFGHGLQQLGFNQNR
jgi:hypothetical protein